MYDVKYIQFPNTYTGIKKPDISTVNCLVNVTVLIQYFPCCDDA